MSEDEIRSPCISVCVLDDNDICMGCFRSAQEVTDWFMASDEEKRAILVRVEERREKASFIRLS